MTWTSGSHPWMTSMSNSAWRAGPAFLRRVQFTGCSGSLGYAGPEVFDPEEPGIRCMG